MTIKFAFNKLIRDKIPDIIRKKNINIFAHTLGHTQYVMALQQKLLEEAEEATEAKSKEEITEELADLFEIAYALAKTHDINPEDIEHARLLKNEARGAFNDKIFASYIEMSMDHKDAKYYLARPNKYPKIS